MKKLLLSGVVLLVLLVPMSAAGASELDARAIESIMVDLESMIGRIEGVDFATLKVRSHENGLRSVAIPLSEATRERLLARSANASDFKTMAVGAQLSEPSNLSALITAVSALENTFYNFWFAVGNLRTTDQVKKTTFQLKGPGDRFKIVENLLYEALHLVVFWAEESSGDPGFHTIQCKVANGGKAKTIIFTE